MDGRKLLYAHLSLLGANIIYGLNYSIAKILMPDYIKPLGLVALRALVATSLFWLISVFLPKERIERKDLLYLLAFFMFGVVFNQVFFLLGLDKTTPINASLLMLVNPILAIIFGAIILKERFSGTRLAGVLTGLSGTALLILGRGRFSFSQSFLIGDVLILLTAASWALFLVVMKRMTDKYSSYTVMKWVFLFGLLPNLAIGNKQLLEVSFINFPLAVILAFIFVTVFTTYIGYTMNIYGLKYVSPTVVSTYVYLQPLVAVVISIALGQDKLTMVKIISALLVFTGVWLVSLNGVKSKFRIRNSR